MYGIFDEKTLTRMAKDLYREERRIDRLDGWFLAKEKEMLTFPKYETEPKAVRRAHLLCEVLGSIPLSLSDNAIFVGTQRDAFAKSYALINPSFTVEGFSGYCDPLAIYNDIAPNEEFPPERINRVREFTQKSEMVHRLGKTYGQVEKDTKEVIYFVEQVSGHVIPDFRTALRRGLGVLICEAEAQEGEYFRAMAIALSGVQILVDRYLALIAEQRRTAGEVRDRQLAFMQEGLSQIREGGATNLFEAIQLYLLLWEVMCLEQAPNPYAFSVGNADRIFEPYRGDLRRDEVAALFKHFLVFYNVGDRSWAISQNVLISGRDWEGRDLTNPTTYGILDAYFDMNLPQPILSVKLHQNTPAALYEEMGRFFFSPGVLTPSLFNDDALFSVLAKHGIAPEDIPDYAVAGCQEPLIMGKDNGNTTGSWLSLPKVLEMVLLGGTSAITGEKLMETEDYTLASVREVFYRTLEGVLDRMVKAANGAAGALSELSVPFLSAFMGGLTTGVDMRDEAKQGTRYNGTGCLVHGLSVLADSFVAIDLFREKYPEGKDLLQDALRANFAGDEEVRALLRSAPKFGNNHQTVDKEAAEIARRVSGMIRRRKNYLGNPFRPDFSTPSTHLTYGYWVGATPDGRGSREMLGYGVDPLYGDATQGLGFRMLSNMRLPFEEFNGGYASHLGIDPRYFDGKTEEEKGRQFYERVVAPLFFNPMAEGVSPFYLYVNVTTPEILRKVLAEPEKYAPSGVYIMRIHGTFVNFLDLSPDIQEDIIKRLDPASTALC